jgi:hypothetical protein
VRKPRRVPLEGPGEVAAGLAVVEALRVAYRALDSAHRESWQRLGAGDETTLELTAATGSLGRAWDSVSERLRDPRTRRP